MPCKNVVIECYSMHEECKKAIVVYLNASCTLQATALKAISLVNWADIDNMLTRWEKVLFVSWF